MRINSYLIRSKSALGHRRWDIDPALGHRSCAGPSILRWSIDSVDARMTRAPRAARIMHCFGTVTQFVEYRISVPYGYGTGTDSVENRN